MTGFVTLKSAFQIAFLSLIAIVACTAIGFSEELSPEQQTALQARVDNFTQIIGKGQMEAVFDYMPPKVLELFATQAGVSVDKVKEATKAQIDEAMKTVKFDSFSMDMNADVPGKLADGLVYTLIPTETNMTVEGTGKFRATSETLALNDGGVWYLVRIDTPAQSDLVKKIYPGFAGVTFKTGTMEPVK